MRFGVQFWRFDWEGGAPAIGPRLAASAAIVDEAGAASLWQMDHFFQMEARLPAEQPMLEGYTSLGFLAGCTRTARLGLLVTGVTYRHPGLLAKTVTTLDVLSGGRAILGIGAAWYDREHAGLGVPFPPVAERFERLEEAIRVYLQMCSGEVGPFEGRHYRLAETLNEPLPITRPHPPILIGGGGERKTLRLVARYADACNLFAPEPAFVAGKLDVLRRHCDAEGRDYDRIEKTILWGRPVDDADATLADLAPYAGLGVDTVLFQVGAAAEADAERIAALAPRLADVRG